MRPDGNEVDKLFIATPGNIFVFGSNLAGIHGAGAARYAWRFAGAEWTVGDGLSRSSYAIPTKNEHLHTLPLDVIATYVDKFILFAWEHRELTFFVTRIGCGLAGYQNADIAPFFKEAPPNCDLPYGWERLSQQ